MVWHCNEAGVGGMKFQQRRGVFTLRIWMAVPRLLRRKGAYKRRIKGPHAAHRHKIRRSIPRLRGPRVLLNSAHFR